MFNAKKVALGAVKQAVRKSEDPSLPYSLALEALDTLTRLYDDLARSFHDAHTMNNAFPESIEEVDAVLREAALEAEALSKLVHARGQRLVEARKALMAARRERYLADAPFKLGEPVCYSPGDMLKDQPGIPSTMEVVRGTLNDYVLSPYHVNAVVDGVMISASALRPVDAMTRLGDLVQEERKLLPGHPPGRLDDTPDESGGILYLTKRYGGRQNAENTPLDPYDCDSPDDRSFDSGELDRHDQNHDQDQLGEPRDIKEHHGPITVEPSDAVVIQSDPVDEPSEVDE